MNHRFALNCRHWTKQKQLLIMLFTQEHANRYVDSVSTERNYQSLNVLFMIVSFKWFRRLLCLYREVSEEISKIMKMGKKKFGIQERRRQKKKKNCKREEMRKLSRLSEVCKRVWISKSNLLITVQYKQDDGQCNLLTTTLNAFSFAIIFSFAVIATVIFLSQLLPLQLEN